LKVVLERTIEFFTIQHHFALIALAGSMLVGLCCAVLGVFVVLRGLSLVGDAAGHATLPGVVAGFLLAGAKSLPAIYLGALLSAGAASALIAYLNGRPRGRPDASIGVALSFFFGLGIVLLSYAQNHSSGGQAGLNAFLFGNAAGMTLAQLLVLGAVTLLTVISCLLFFRIMESTTFDPTWSASVGFHPKRVNLAVMIWIAVVVVVSVQSVGVVLVSAMLVIAPTAALVGQKNLKKVLILAAAFGLLAGLIGAWASFVYEGVGTGPAMVLASAGILASTLLFRQLRMR